MSNWGSLSPEWRIPCHWKSTIYDSKGLCQDAAKPFLPWIEGSKSTLSQACQKGNN